MRSQCIAERDLRCGGDFRGDDSVVRGREVAPAAGRYGRGAGAMAATARWRDHRGGSAAGFVSTGGRVDDELAADALPTVSCSYLPSPGVGLA